MDEACARKSIRIINDDADLQSLIEETLEGNVNDDAFYICDVGDIIKKYQKWMQLMPRVQPFYAVKCNDSQIVLSTLAAIGAGFDCASQVEIMKVLNTGVEPSRVIFANAAKPASHIKYAKECGVIHMTFDSESELYKIQKFFPTAKMVLRVRFDAEACAFRLGNKFGCDPETEAPHLLNVAHSLGIDVDGISFHVGSGCPDAQIFYAAIETCRKLFDYSEQEIGHKMSFLDIGGGFKGAKNDSIDEIAFSVNKALVNFFPDNSVRVISEPGTYFVQSAFTLFCNVYATRTVGGKQDPKRHNMYFVNDGIYGSLNVMLYEQIRIAPKLWKTSSTNTFSSSIWGPTCDSVDLLWSEILLPEVQIGDWMIFENAGAYTLTCATKFNGFPCPPVFFYADVNSWHTLRNTKYFHENDFFFRSDKCVWNLINDSTAQTIRSKL